MVDAAGVQRIGQRADHVLLPDQFGETLRAPLAGEDEIGHRPHSAVPRRNLPRRDAVATPGHARAAEPRSRLVVMHRRRLESAPLKRGSQLACRSSGEVSEWLKEHAWKVCKRLNRASGVRIPLSPPASCSRRAQRMRSKSLWWPRRPLATLGRKPRQGRKAATVSTDAGAEVSRRGHRHFQCCALEIPRFAAQILGPGDVLPIPAASPRPLTKGAFLQTVHRASTASTDRGCSQPASPSA